MGHVKGHPEDAVRQFIEHSFDTLEGLVPSSFEKIKKDKFGRIISRSRLLPTLGASGLGLAALMVLQNQDRLKSNAERARAVLEELDKQSKQASSKPIKK